MKPRKFSRFSLPKNHKSTCMRTPNEIVERIEAILDAKKELAIFECSELVLALPFEMAKKYIKDDILEENWNVEYYDRDSILREMQDYFPFTMEKIEGKRGLSVICYIACYRSWIWLLGDEDYEVIDWTKATNLGKDLMLEIGQKYNLTRA